jgi:hypothetical protein
MIREFERKMDDWRKSTAPELMEGKVLSRRMDAFNS